MALGPFKHFRYRGKVYTRCTGCGMVGYEGWAHVHANDVDGHEYGVNWYRSVSELEHRLKEGRVPPPGLRGTRA